MEHYKFFQNKACEFFPCHKCADPETFNCLFCYCPLYALGDKCKGNCTFLQNGIKDCSNCLIPHNVQNYDLIMQRMQDVMKLAAKPTDNA